MLEISSENDKPPLDQLWDEFVAQQTDGKYPNPEQYPKQFEFAVLTFLFQKGYNNG